MHSRQHLRGCTCAVHLCLHPSMWLHLLDALRVRCDLSARISGLFRPRLHLHDALRVRCDGRELPNTLTASTGLHLLDALEVHCRRYAGVRWLPVYVASSRCTRTSPLVALMQSTCIGCDMLHLVGALNICCYAGMVRGNARIVRLHLLSALWFAILVRAEGIEPPTCRLRAECSAN
jgi:hypothetical protein